MNKAGIASAPRGFRRFLAVILAVTALATAGAEEKQHLTTIHQGGFPGRPVLTGIQATTNGVKLTWDGPSGYYQLFQKLGLTNQAWQKVGGPNLNRTTNLATVAGSAFFKVAGPQALYAGSQACLECHEGIHHSAGNTRHAEAFTNPLFIAKGGQTNSSCLPCHTVGFGLPSGFISKNDPRSLTKLAGVQCESCHGPAANHAANEMDLTVRPRVEIAGQVCGGCHNEASHRPHYEEWKSSGHFAVVEDMNPAGRINSCGRCHSGTSRLALLKGEDPAVTVANDANVGITCAVCHDPHATHVFTNVLSGLVYTNQLRNPLSSTNDYSLSTASLFATNYNANINVCAQCHNHRGATWTSSGRPPHHSPQYNVLLGTVGEMAPGITASRAAHGTLIEKQCVGCHMPEMGDGSDAQPHYASHTFKVESFESCLKCHPLPELLVVFTSGAVASQIQELKGYLDLWATTKAPAALRAKYGARAWEYTTPGELSPGGVGPTSAEQAQIPDGIKKARFNLYIVKNDGSYGVHNGPHTVSLLESAQTWIQEELNK